MGIKGKIKIKMKKISTALSIVIISSTSIASDTTNCNAGEKCKAGNNYITLDQKSYEYSTKMGVKHTETRDMTVKCIVNKDGSFVAPESVEVHCTSTALWCSQKHNTGDRVVITCYNSKTSGDTLHLKVDQVDCKNFVTGKNGSNSTRVRAKGCTWGSINW